jgi:hypothetical protein
MKQFLFYLLLFTNLCAFAQNAFPESWIGNWKGELEIIAPASGAVQAKFPMEIKIAATEKAGEWSWTIIYNHKDVRNYLLRTKDKSRGLYEIDELNKIVLDLAVFGNTTVSSFEVDNMRIVDFHELKDGKMYFSLISYDESQTNLSGSGTAEIPTVKSNVVTAMQRAVLEREK